MRNILDNKLSANWGNHIFDDREIIWQGAPRFKSIFPFFDKRFGVFQYAFTDKKVLIKNTRWLWPKIHSISFSAIHRMTYEYYEDGSGTIYFMTVNPPGFKTHNLENAKDRFYPTFEHIPDVQVVFEQLYKQWQLSIQKNGLEQRTLNSTKHQWHFNALMWGKRLIYIVLGLFLFYAADFYLLPAKVVQDELLESDYTIHMRRYVPSEIGRKGRYQTKKHLFFGTEVNTYELRRQSIQITYSPVFRSVKNVFLENGSNIKHSLANDFNGVPGIFQWVTISFFIAGTLRIRNAKSVKDDEFWQTMITAGVMLLVSCYFWYQYN